MAEYAHCRRCRRTTPVEDLEGWYVSFEEYGLVRAPRLNLFFGLPLGFAAHIDAVCPGCMTKLELAEFDDDED